jgi:hypothetical protein
MGEGEAAKADTGLGMTTLASNPNLTRCSSSPAARELISIIPLNLLGKNGAVMQRANISNGKPKIDKMLRRG